MRNTLQEQYNLIKEGKGNKQQFFKSARHLFPDLITPVNTYEDTVRILKNKSIIAEGIGGVVTKGKTPDWHAIFKENITEAAKEAKAEEKETTKEVTDMATRGYDYKDYKNIDNVFGETFLKGFYTEMGDPKNEGKTVEELKQIVAKNLAKDCLHYTKEGQFGLKGVGYTMDIPGLGEPKPAKGKHKSSGYGDLQESVLRSQIYLLAKEILTEGIHDKDITSAPHTNVKGEMGDYDPKARAASLARLANFGPKSKTENTDVLDQHLSVIQANGYTKDEAYSYLEDQVGLTDQQLIDDIINSAFPSSTTTPMSSTTNVNDLYSQLEKEYFQGDNIEGLMSDPRFKSLPREMRTKLHRVIFNNMRQNYY
jgi:hypothetical protein